MIWIDFPWAVFFNNRESERYSKTKKDEETETETETETVRETKTLWKQFRRKLLIISVNWQLIFDS